MCGNNNNNNNRTVGVAVGRRTEQKWYRNYNSIFRWKYLSVKHSKSESVRKFCLSEPSSLSSDKPAASEGADGEVRGSRSSLVRMRDVDPPEVPLRQAPYNPPQDVASNSGSLVQVAEQAHPLVQRCPSPNPMREHRNNRTHEEVVVGGGATPHG